jgi:hypothetical protein
LQVEEHVPDEKTLLLFVVASIGVVPIVVNRWLLPPILHRRRTRESSVSRIVQPEKYGRFRSSIGCMLQNPELPPPADEQPSNVQIFKSHAARAALPQLPGRHSVALNMLPLIQVRRNLSDQGVI